MLWPWRRSFLHFAFHWQLCSCVTAAPRKVCASGCIASCAGSQVGGRVCEGEREIHDFRFFPKCLKVCAHCLRYKKPVMLLAARISLLCPAGAHSLFGSPRGEIRPVQTLIQKTRRLKKKTHSRMTARGDADIESLRKRTYRPLDVFLLVSIIFLFLALSAVVAAVVIAVKRPECFVLQGKDDSGPPAFKVRKILLGQKVGIVLFCGPCSQS